MRKLVGIKALLLTSDAPSYNPKKTVKVEPKLEDHTVKKPV